MFPIRVKSKQMIQVKKEILEQLRTNLRAKGRLAYEFSRTTKTIDQWIDENDIMLTTATGLKAISEELGVRQSEILKAEK